ncbi:hypothetical protein CANMA_005349 [Candida margitis]|uniref:uncharacterized protein n=1 Tax=Candida margitis TaxID=1775924 RepID=UPI0022262F4C|nr:uncharacterized protein CANMA_005349 [Candida margitis]KAI5950421.1 hypothetical protein CANMA_005349 [Candida margitis]
MNQEVNKISNQFSKTLKLVDEKFIKSGKLEWRQIRRTPQFWKQKLNYPGNSYTSDEEFNAMESQFKAQEIHLKELLEELKDFAKTTLELLKGSELVAHGFQDIIDPYSNFKNSADTIDEAYNSWTRISTYKHHIQSINFASQINSFINNDYKKLEEVGCISKLVSKKINSRHVFLLDYDKLYNEYEVLCEKQERNELSLKQSNSIYSIKRKLDDSKVKYESINACLKSNLPKFLYNVQEVINVLQIKFQVLNDDFFRLLVANLQMVQSIEDISTITFCFKERNEPLFSEIEQLSIITINHAVDYSKSVPEADLGFCYALYDFNGVEPGDLSFKRGNRIRILERTGSWWVGEIMGQHGSFPANYVKLE